MLSKIPNRSNFTHVANN